MASRLLDDYIVVIENIIPQELCKAIIDEYAHSDLWSKSIVRNVRSNTTVDDSYRNSQEIGISNTGVLSNSTARMDIDKQVFNAASNCLGIYARKFPFMRVGKDMGYRLLRYQEGGFSKEHVDTYTDQPRTLTCSFCLNDDFTGGEWAFFGREKIINLNKGAAVLFPSTFAFPHQILPITSGTRYSLVTWFL